MTFTDSTPVKFVDRCTDCAICGKRFYVQSRSQYTYKVRNKNKIMKFMCSYSCYNKALSMLKDCVYPSSRW